MAESTSIGEWVKNLFGKQYYKLEPKGQYPDETTLNIEDQVDTTLKPTKAFKEFMEIETFDKGYKFLKKRYKKLKDDEKKWQNRIPTDEKFPEESVAYWFSLKIYTRALRNKLALANLNEKEAKLAFEELENSKKRFEEESPENGRADFEVMELGMKVLEKIIALKLVLGNDKIMDFLVQYTTDENEYMNRR